MNELASLRFHSDCLGVEVKQLIATAPVRIVLSAPADRRSEVLLPIWFRPWFGRDTKQVVGIFTLPGGTTFSGMVCWIFSTMPFTWDTRRPL